MSIAALAALAAFALHRLAPPANFAVVHPAPTARARLALPDGPRWSAPDRAKVRKEVSAALQPALAGAAGFSCIVLAQDGTVLYADRPDAVEKPASTEKLIVAAAALHDLGPDFRFDTLLAARELPRAGRLEGDLWLDGSGDPTLASEDLRAGIKRLWLQGLRSITGGVVVDASAISGEEINPLWNPGDANEPFESAVSGISLDQDTVAFHLQGTRPGEPASVRVSPPSSAVRYDGSVTTSGDGGDDAIVAAAQAPNTFILSGVIPPGIEETYKVPVHGIPRYVGSVVDRMLRRQGITFARRARTGITPLTARILWEHRSHSLRRIVARMLYVSDNHFAEQLMRTLGGMHGAPADDADGIAAERSYLHEMHVPVPGLYLVDGSGLAHANRVAAVTLATILWESEPDRESSPLYPLLPRGGYDGTLKYYGFTQALGRVRAKSGTLADANALAGYVNSRHHGRLVFAFVIDGSPGDPVDAMISAVDRLSDF